MPERGEVERRLRRFLKNAAWLALSLILLVGMDLALGGIRFRAFGVELDTTEVIGVFRLMSIIYFGYWVLRDGLYLLDLTAGLLTEALELGEAGGPRRIGLDVLYLISLGLGWLAASPFLGILPELASRAAALAFLSLAVVFVYDAVKTSYSLIRSRVEALVEVAAGVLSEVRGGGRGKGVGDQSAPERRRRTR